MNLSTSSSDTSGSSRSVYWRILLAIVIGMTVALILVQLFVKANGAGSRSLLGRVIEAQEAIPKIAAEENDLVMFLVRRWCRRVSHHANLIGIWPPKASMSRHLILASVG